MPTNNWHYHWINFQNQVKGFFERIALTQLNITKREYDDDTNELTLQEIADYLTDRAHILNKEIPNSKVLLQSIIDDYKMALKCTFEWYPPEVSALVLWYI